ncbi:MAG: hypothetical protein KIG60_04480 [Caryophanon sp.]|nr:hypothetical protein [Caryophanon sp.]
MMVGSSNEFKFVNLDRYYNYKTYETDIAVQARGQRRAAIATTISCVMSLSVYSIWLNEDTFHIEYKAAFST